MRTLLLMVLVAGLLPKRTLDRIIAKRLGLVPQA